VQEDDEFDEVGVRLLPEWFPLALPNKVVKERSDVVGQSIRIEVVVKRVVAILRVARLGFGSS
jgi:hypothetical protein